MVKMSTVDNQLKRLEFKHSGNKNRMVKICRAISHIQAHSPVKGKYRRHGERRVTNSLFVTFYAERQAELLKRATAKLDANGQR